METLPQANVAVKHVSSTRRRYAAVNGTWPETLPPLTAQEAIAAAKRLYRFGLDKAWPGRWELTSGNRYSWPRGRTFYVNPDRGWHSLVHFLSHYCHSRKFPTDSPHDPAHAYVESRMIQYVLDHGWLDGKLKRPEKSRPDAKRLRYESVVRRISTWERKAARAKTALKKLSRQRAYYERTS